MAVAENETTSPQMLSECMQGAVPHKDLTLVNSYLYLLRNSAQSITINGSRLLFLSPALRTGLVKFEIYDQIIPPY